MKTIQICVDNKYRSLRPATEQTKFFDKYTEGYQVSFAEHPHPMYPTLFFLSNRWESNEEDEHIVRFLKAIDKIKQMDPNTPIGKFFLLYQRRMDMQYRIYHARTSYRGFPGIIGMGGTSELTLDPLLKDSKHPILQYLENKREESFFTGRYSDFEFPELRRTPKIQLSSNPFKF